MRWLQQSLGILLLARVCNACFIGEAIKGGLKISQIKGARVANARLGTFDVYYLLGEAHLTGFRKLPGEMVSYK